MSPLLEIKTVPIEIQMKTKSASLEYTRGTAEMEISRSDKGSLEVKSRPIQLKLDSFEPRGTSYRPSVATASAAASAANAAPTVAAPSYNVYEATSAYVDQGQIQLSARVGHSMAQDMQQYAAASAANDDDGQTASAAGGLKTGVNVEWGEDGTMQIRYAMDKLKFDWKINQGEFKFTPGDIEVTIAQRPSVTFKYTGGPLYVPRSSDPNYEPVNVEA